ncbi:MAG TPA: hypothetical protein PK299_03570, partial [Anaerolineales bacterium]|nr:hypothetical protein [Anaerolineales bacterium]
SRKRKGYPRYFLEWTLEEQLTYLSFPNANDLALALSSENEKEKALALLAMKYVQHIRSSYWDWFGDQQYFLSRLQDIFYIGFQETLSDDFEVIKKKLALPKDLNLPTDPIQSHKNPDHFDKKLSATGIENLRKWYAKDIEFFEFCKSIALKTNNHE